MLGKTAGGLFWMFRYLERAENTARLLEAGWRIALTRTGEAENEWQSVITTAGLAQQFNAAHDEYDAPEVIDFLLRGKTNPTSVLASLAAARSNARLVRTALSSEVWEATNECWMEAKALLARPVSERTLYDTLARIKFRSAVVRGALHGTMLRNDIFSFARLGTFIERGDNTARILDVKYYVLLPATALVGTRIDNAQWENILRSVSAEQSYHWLNGGQTSPMGIAEFLILDRRMPRSLAFCCQKIGENLGQLAQEYGTRHPSHDLADRMCARMNENTIQSIFEAGLHEFLTDSILDMGQIASLIETDYRFYR
ncbi:alpha-E domain-containing protein [Sedimentitalea arenosa]|uniref:Alpha-E domain-containing protein n=1 Tax=Sedimentitalea arenosa TaxID=2798803 RepID=A0A8J7J6D5_9RHOB|nr:alpha-E domain-containing protein [Arenibacterium arenosum]